MMEEPLTRKERERNRIVSAKKQEMEKQEKIALRMSENLGKAANTTSSLWFDKLGEPHEAPSIDERWVESLGFVAFLPQGHRNVAAYELQNNALKKLLQTRYNVFWSHVMYDGELRRFVDTYLRYCQRSYDEEFVSYSGKDIHSEVFQRVFKVLLRASNARESKENFLDVEYHTAWLRSEKNWFDVPRCLDICVLYNTANPKLVQTMISCVFTANNKLFDDLQKTGIILVKTLSKAFEEKSVKERVARDRELFLFDTLCTVYAVLTVFPKAAKQFQRCGLSEMLALCCTKWIPLLTRNRRDKAKRLCLAIGFMLLDLCYFTRVFERGTNKFQENVCKEMIACLEKLDPSSHYMYTMEARYHVSEALKQLLGKGVGMPREIVSSMIVALEGQTAPLVIQVNAEDKAIDSVLEVFPDLGEEYILACLRHMEMKSENVIDALLSETLPAPLQGLDKKTGRPKEDPKKIEVIGKGKDEYEEEEEEEEKPQQKKEEKNINNNDNNAIDISKVSLKMEEMEVCMEEIVEERGERLKSIHQGKRNYVYEENGVDHKMRSFITKYADTYEDEFDDSFAIHAKLSMEPLAEDEEEGKPIEKEEESVDSVAVSVPVARGRGKSLAKSKKTKPSKGRKNQSMKKHGLL